VDHQNKKVVCGGFAEEAKQNKKNGKNEKIPNKAGLPREKPPSEWAPHINSDQPLINKALARRNSRFFPPPLRSLAVAAGEPSRMTQSTGGGRRGNGRGRGYGHYHHHSALCCLSGVPPLPGDAPPTPEPEAASASVQGQGAAVAVEGVLHKWTNYGRGWRERWFSLRDGVLSYSKIRAGAHGAGSPNGDAAEVRLIGARIGGGLRTDKPAGVVYLKVRACQRSLAPLPRHGSRDPAAWWRRLGFFIFFFSFRENLFPTFLRHTLFSECNSRVLLQYLLPWQLQVVLFSPRLLNLCLAFTIHKGVVRASSDQAFKIIEKSYLIGSEFFRGAR
jgi:hypothetical protein